MKMKEGKVMSRLAPSVLSLAAGWILVSAAAYATTIDDNATTGVFTNPVGIPGSSEDFFSGTGTENFSWGDPFEPGDHKSSLTYTPIGFSCEQSTLCTFATITFTNGTIKSNTALNELTLELTIDAEEIDPDPNVPPLPVTTEPILHPANIIESLDVPQAQNDIVRFRLNIDPFLFDLPELLQDELFDEFNVPEDDASTATLWGVFPLPGGPESGLSQQNALRALQGEPQELVFAFLGYGEVVDGNGFLTSSIPEPGSLALLGVGLLMVLLLRVRANKSSGAQRASARFASATSSSE